MGRSCPSLHRPLLLHRHHQPTQTPSPSTKVRSPNGVACILGAIVLLLHDWHVFHLLATLLCLLLCQHLRNFQDRGVWCHSRQLAGDHQCCRNTLTPSAGFLVRQVVWPTSDTRRVKHILSLYAICLDIGQVAWWDVRLGCDIWNSYRGHTGDFCRGFGIAYQRSDKDGNEVWYGVFGAWLLHAGRAAHRRRND